MCSHPQASEDSLPTRSFAVDIGGTMTKAVLVHSNHTMAFLRCPSENIVSFLRWLHAGAGHEPGSDDLANHGYQLVGVTGGGAKKYGKLITEEVGRWAGEAPEEVDEMGSIVRGLSVLRKGAVTLPGSMQRS